MARSSYDFPALNPGQFWHRASAVDGTTMVGWGRSYRSKFVQLDQAEITAFLAAGAKMLRTDDTELKGLLDQLAKALAGIEPPLTFDQISVLAATNPAVGPRFAEIIAGPAAGNIDKAREILTRELREQDTKLAQLAS